MHHHQSTLYFTQVINVYRDPTGDNIFSGTTPSTQTFKTQSKEHHNMAVGISELTETERNSLLTSRVQSLEQKMKDKDRRIVELENIIKS